ncbi:hypothetical protein LCGC14_0765030 [marine sediment metagenome]|uniref:Uncharacterized protein n=1 Tax=marine sediment metagenome TaxID=412755 RepID=A0A0F9Q4A1_9ZZZZ
MSETRKRFLELKKQKQAERKRLKGMVVCRGKIERRGEKVKCEYALFPRKDAVDAVFTCHRCHTIHIMTVHGWRTLKEANASRIDKGDEQ